MAVAAPTNLGDAVQNILNQSIGPKSASAAVADQWVTDEHRFFGALRKRERDPMCPLLEDVEEFIYDHRLTLPIRAMMRGYSLFLVGPTGAGKSLFSRWFAYQLGLAYLEMPHDAHFEIEDVLGKPVQDSTGIWSFEDGPLPKLFREGGVYNADEMPAIKASIAQHYHPFVRGKSIFIRTKGKLELVRRAPNFHFIATGNPWHTYRGNYEPGQALLNRFWMVEFDYLPAQEEKKVLEAYAPTVPVGWIDGLINFANQWRGGAKSNPDAHKYPVSTRTLCDVVGAIDKLGASLKDAVEHLIFTPARIDYFDEFDSLQRILAAHLDIGT